MATTLKDVLASEKHEEWVRYFVFPGKHEGGDPDEKEQFFRLNAAAQGLIGDYIWHNEPFVLKRGSAPLSEFDEDDDDNGEDKRSEKEREKTPYFYGVTHFGDNLEDEWFIVYILRELSKMFPDVVVKVEDNDGEFLLIEAADHLPDWAESDESCKNRVYIHQGRVHLIPEALTPNCSVDNGLKIPEAVDLIWKYKESPSTETLANQGIQSAIASRIGNYPQKIKDNFHQVTIMLPPFLATILNQKPNLVSVGSLAFYLRDPISLKATRLMKMSKAADGLVKSRVRFTKCLFAMLMKQDFRPDKRSGWTLPSPTSPDYKAYSLGAKLATGFEIVLEQGSNSNSNGESNHDAQDSSWLRYEEALKKTGYFKGFMEGSKPYQDLLSGAKDFFNTNLKNVEDAPPSVYSWKEAVYQEIKKLAETVKVDLDKLKKDSETLEEDDDDSWLAIKPEDLESLLEAKFQTGGLNPDDIPSKLKEFMKQISDFSGVEPSDGASHQSNSPSSTGTGSPRENGGAAGDTQQVDNFGEKFDFKADEFVSAMDKLLHDLGAPDKDFAASDDSFGSDEDEFNVDLESIRKMHTFSKESQEFFGMMGQMDKELASTTMGQTFKSSASGPGQTKTTASTSSTKPKVTTANVEELDEFDKEGLTPVNIDMNALANILESFQSQDGPSGPSANLLRSVGFDMNRAMKK